MIRAQRRVHAIVWMVLGPALLLGLVWALLARPDLTQPDPAPVREASP